MTSNKRTTTVALIAAGCVFALVAALAVVLAPRAASLSEQRTGDAALATTWEDTFQGATTGVIAVMDSAEAAPRFAGFGADEHREYEIGSVSKAVTTTMLQQLVDAEELTLTTTVGEILDGAQDGGGGTDAALPDAAALVDYAPQSPLREVTVEELATHTSGLPRIDRSWTDMLYSIQRKDPYTATATELLQTALDAELATRGSEQYSNIGTAVLGQLLALHMGTPYEELLAEQITEPLGLSATYAPITSEGLRPDAPHGYTANGQAAAPWTMLGYAPAGGIRSSAADMLTFLDAAASGEVADLDMFSPRGPAERGLGWALTDGTASGVDDVIWHNGATGGFSSFIGINPATGQRLVLIADAALGEQITSDGISYLQAGL